MIDELAEAKLRHPSSGVLQEVIATNAVRAFNEGFERGRVAERDRIIKLLEDNWIEPMDWLSVKELIKGEQK